MVYLLEAIDSRDWRHWEWLSGKGSIKRTKISMVSETDTEILNYFFL